MSTSHHNDIRSQGDLVLRTLFILFIPIIASGLTFLIIRLMIPSFVPPDFRAPANSPLTPVVVLVVFASALVILVRLGRPTLSALLLIGVWTLVMTFTALRVGVNTYFPALLILPICAAGLLIDRFAAIALAGLATLLVGSVAWLEWQGMLHSPPPQLTLIPQLPWISFGFWLGLFWAVAALTALLAGRMQAALQRSSAHAEELRLLSAQLEERVQEQTTRLLAREREAATLEERNRLAREIHDTLAQGLAGVVVQLGALRRAMDVAPQHTHEHLQMTEQMARETLAEARRSVWNLRAAALERGTLADALRSLAEQRNTSSLAATFVQHGEAWPLPPAVESALLRIAQEALANVVKHAAATQVTITLDYTAEHVGLEVRDNGPGFPATTLSQPTANQNGGFGLLGIRERLTQLGGSLEISNENGAVVRADIPRSQPA